MKNCKIEEKIKEYIDNPRDAMINFELACDYYGIQQYASAISYYLRCAEISDDKDLVYESLLSSWMCIKNVGDRPIFERGQLLTIISQSPHRPEAYYHLCGWLENYGKDVNGSNEETFQQMHSYACIGINNIKNNKEFIYYKEYPGYYGLMFYKAFSAWQIGQLKESEDIFIDLYNNHKLDKNFKQYVYNNIKNLNIEHKVIKRNEVEDFDWGPVKDNHFKIFNKEVLEDKVYEKLFKVNKDDIVVDLGSNVGSFTYSIINNKPKKVYCIEPEKDCFKTLKNNFINHKNVVCINKAINYKNGQEMCYGLYDSGTRGNDFYSKQEVVDSINFKTLINKYSIEKIDFLKVDCERGEYSIFSKENLPWIKERVHKIVGEWHITWDEDIVDFNMFIDTYLNKGDFSYKAYSMKGEDITSKILDKDFVNNIPTRGGGEGAIMLYIENKKFNNNIKPLKKHWNITDWPTLEFTTTIPKNGCVVDCVFCPQRTLQKVWDSKHFTTHKERTMSIEQFKMVIDKLPIEVRVTFSGFIEPYMNKHCSDMMLYAHEQGHRISVFTTGVGMTLKDVEKIKNIPFCGGPNGGFTLHLPDEERKAKHPVTKTYIKVIEAIKNANISNFMVMAMGTTHNEVTHLYPDYEVNKYTMWHRAGNLIGEAQLKPELTDVMGEVKSVFRNDKRTCGCIEDLYHNILLPNGDVSLCCMDYNLEEILGNLYTQEYGDIMPKKNTTYDMCSRCENGVIPIDEGCEITEGIPEDSEFNEDKWRRIMPYINNDYTTAVETGTFLGSTTKFLMKHFEKVHTIELDEGLYKIASEKFKNNKNVQCHLGDSSTILREKLISELNKSKDDKKVFFFLDAHWSGDDDVDWENSKWKGAYSHERGKNTAHRGNSKSPTAIEQVPLEEEIMHIYNNFEDECLICIDDWDKIGEDGVGKKNDQFIGEDWTNINFNIIKTKINNRLIGKPFMIDQFKMIIKLKKK